MAPLLVDLDGPARLPLSYVAGFEWELDIDVYDDELETVEHNFVAEDILFIVRRYRDAEAPELTRASDDDGRITIDAISPAPTTATGAGRLEIRIPSSSTETFETGCYWYWLSSWPTGVEDAEQGWLEGPLDIRAGNGD